MPEHGLVSLGGQSVTRGPLTRGHRQAMEGGALPAAGRVCRFVPEHGLVSLGGQSVTRSPYIISIGRSVDAIFRGDHST